MQGPEDDPVLAGKVALVSGGGASGDGIGNGRAAAILLAGARVLVADRDLKLADRIVEMIRADGGTAATHGGDVTGESDCITRQVLVVDGGVTLQAPERESQEH